MCKLYVLHRNTKNHITMFELLELDRNTLNYITVQIISIRRGILETMWYKNGLGCGVGKL